MTQLLIQDAFAPPSSPASRSTESLVIHRRSESPARRNLVVFVHGLHGDSYGKNPTWGDLPAMLYSEFPYADLAFFSYPNGIRRFRYWGTAPLNEQARLLATMLRECSKDYSGLVLVGHSLGGILSKAAIRHIKESNQAKLLKRFKGLVLMASPQCGSLRVPSFVRFSDFVVLRSHSAYLNQLNQFFVNNLCLHLNSRRAGCHGLPTWAILAAADHWVDEFSASLGLPDSQIFRVPGGHTKLVKPSSPLDDGYASLKTSLSHALAIKASALASHQGPVGFPLCSPARLEDLQPIQDLAHSLLGLPVEPIDDVKGWLDREPEAVWSIRREYRLAGSKVRQEVVGYFCVLPITENAARQILSGDTSASGIRTTDVVPAGTPKSYVYVGALLGSDLQTKGIALERLKSTLSHWAGTERLTLITRPITPDGLRTAHNFGLRGVIPGKEGLHDLFQGTFTTDGSA